MKFFDLWFNGGMLAASAVCGYVLFRFRGHPRKLWIHAAALAGYILAALICFRLAYRMTPNARFFFMSGRFAGMFLFWYFPAFLLATAAVMWAYPVRRWAHAGMAVLLLALYGYSYWVEPFWLEVSHYTYTTPALSGLERPVVIAQVADFQTERFGAYEERAIREIAAQQPDIIAYCGDYYTIGPETIQAAGIHALFTKVEEACERAPLAMYAVTGDCEFPRAVERAVTNTGVLDMDDEARMLALPGVEINVVGLSRGTSRWDKKHKLAEILSRTPPNRFTLIVGHAPEYAFRLADHDRPFLALAGHTHGGQVRLPFFGPLTTATDLPRKFADAFAPLENGVLSVSRGIGMERYDAPQIRFRCRPELRIITLMPPE